jgi:hypothetical protein
MSWNYRVMEFEEVLENEEKSKFYEIKEVYYNRDGTLMGYCDATVGGESFGDVLIVLNMMKQDAHKSVLRPSDFKKEKNENTY